MTTLNQLSYDLLGVLRSGGKNITDDEGVTLRQISFWIKNTRANLIRQQLQKRQSISDNITQVIPCLDVSQVDPSTCCDFTTDCFVVRTDLQLPKPIESNQSDLITKVMLMSRLARSIPFIPYSRVPFWASSRFNKDQPAAFLSDRYLYVINSDFLDKIAVQGVWDDPTELKNYSTCDSVSCFTDDSEYPISSHMIEIMKKMIIDTNFKFLLQDPVDKHNDADSSVSNNIHQ